MPFSLGHEDEIVMLVREIYRLTELLSPGIIVARDAPQAVTYLKLAEFFSAWILIMTSPSHLLNLILEAEVLLLFPTAQTNILHTFKYCCIMLQSRHRSKYKEWLVNLYAHIIGSIDFSARSNEPRWLGHYATKPDWESGTFLPSSLAFNIMQSQDMPV